MSLLYMLTCITQIGENIVLRRGVTFTCKKEGYQLIGLTHPSGNAASVNYGRYGTVMAYTKDPNSGELPEGQTPGKKRLFVECMKSRHLMYLKTDHPKMHIQISDIYCTVNVLNPNWFGFHTVQFRPLSRQIGFQTVS